MPRVVPQYTIRDPVVTDVEYIRFTPRPKEGGGFETECLAHYKLKDEVGNVVVDGSVSFVLSAGVQSTLATFTTNNILPIIRTQEDL